MATAVQQPPQNQGPNPGPSIGQHPGQSPNTNANMAQDASSTEHDPPLWDGDKMFNIYIWDYCQKRGYLATAQKLVEEAKLPVTPRPPIDAKQGLLYEWWSVFWVLFSAKNSGNGSEDAMVVVQHHMSRMQSAHAQSAGMRFPPNGPRPGMAPMQPPTAPGATPPQGPGMPPGAVAGMAAGPSAQPMPNGIGPAPPAPGNAPGGPGAQQQQGMHPPPNGPLGFPSHPPHPHPGPHPQGPQPNGVMPGTPTGPHPGQPGAPGMGGPQPPPGVVSRPPVNMAMGMNVRPPFASPTIPHASGSAPGQPGQPGQMAQQQQHPQHPGQPGQQQPNQQGPPYPIPPMGHLGHYPPQHMRAMNMLPPGQNPNGPGNPNQNNPNAPQGANGVPGGPASAASPSHAQSGSRAPTPAMTYGSPSMAHRANPQGGPQQGQPGAQAAQQTPPGFGAPPSVPQGQNRPVFDQVITDFSKIDQQVVQDLKRELGLNKDNSQLTLEEKRHIIQQHAQRNASGPSNQAANARNHQLAQQQQQMRGKRSSASPGDENQNDAQLKGEASPPVNKRQRTSPDRNNPQGGPSAPPNAHGPPAQGPPMPGMFPPNMSNGMRPPGQFTPQMQHMSPGMMQQHQGQMMSSAMPQQMTQQLKNQQYHPAMQQMHMKGAAGMMSPSVPVPNAGDNTSSSDPTTFNPQIDPHRSAPPPFAPNGVVTPTSMSNLANRPPMQGKPGMMPPPSPATNGKPGGQPSTMQNKQDGQGNMLQPKTENSPRTISNATPGSSGDAGPSTPANAQQPQNVSAPSPSQQANNLSRPPTASANPGQAQSGSATPAMAPAVPQQNTASMAAMPSLDEFGFMGSTFDDFSNLFSNTTNGGAVDFEQDFTGWFSPNDLSILESK